MTAPATKMEALALGLSMGMEMPSRSDLLALVQRSNRDLAEQQRFTRMYCEEAERLAASVATLTRQLAEAQQREQAFREIVENFALVERHSETRAHGQQDLYRMPFRGASWFDTREAAVADWLAGLSPSPSEPAR